MVYNEYITERSLRRACGLPPLREGNRHDRRRKNTKIRAGSGTETAPAGSPAGGAAAGTRTQEAPAGSEGAGAGTGKETQRAPEGTAGPGKTAQAQPVKATLATSK